MTSPPSFKTPVSRRLLLKRSFQLAASLAICAPFTTGATSLQKRTLSFYHTHTDEYLRTTYAYGKYFNPQALKEIDYFLRDFRTGERHQIDPSLLNILWKIQQATGREGTYEVISGFRSLSTNRMLRKKSSGIAKRSLHLKGRAIDVRFTGTRTLSLQQTAIALKTGGIGYYPKSDFVHLDTGRFRSW